MTSNTETVVNPVDTPVDLTTRESATVEENRTLRHVVAQLWQAWANGQEPPTSIPCFPEITSIRSSSSQVPISDPFFPPGAAQEGQFTVHPKQYYTPGITFGGPNSVQFGSPIDVERQTQGSEQEEILKKMKSIEQHMKSMEGVGGHKNVAFKDLYQEISHWHIWDDMTQDFVRQFQYNIDIMPDRNTHSNMRKKPNESFREYAIKWREQVARVKPPFDEQELVDIFIEAQDPDYFHHLTAAMGRPFHTTIKIGEMVESGLKIGRIVSQAAIKATTQAIQGGSGSVGNQKRKEEISSLASGSRGAQRNSNCPYPPLQGQSSYPQHYYPYAPQFLVSPSPYTVFNASHMCILPIAHIFGPQLKKTFTHNYHPIRSLTTLILCFQANERCEYHSGAPGHNTDNCWTFKGEIEKLIDHGVFVVTDDQNAPNVTNNPLSTQKNLVGMIWDDQEYKLLGKMGKSFRKIGEEDKSIKSLKPVASLSVECVNLDTKVLCVPGVLKGIEVRAGMPKLYVSKGFSLTEHNQNCLAKLNGPIFVKPVQQLPVTDSKLSLGTITKSLWFTEERRLLKRLMKQEG
ncbi:hypothetical protein KY285_013218 [Solanum tuberosum]|nr:hypothetical protein KY285_013218 [Solanum tuberosum]